MDRDAPIGVLDVLADVLDQAVVQRRVRLQANLAKVFLEGREGWAGGRQVLARQEGQEERAHGFGRPARQGPERRLAHGPFGVARTGRQRQQDRFVPLAIEGEGARGAAVFVVARRPNQHVLGHPARGRPIEPAAQLPLRQPADPLAFGQPRGVQGITQSDPCPTGRGAPGRLRAGHRTSRWRGGGCAPRSHAARPHRFRGRVSRSRSTGRAPPTHRPEERSGSPSGPERVVEPHPR